MISYSQFDIDLYLYQIFNKKPKGFFIEAGANDGYNQNNVATQKKVYNAANEDKLRARGTTEYGDSGYYNDRIQQTNLY